MHCHGVTFDLVSAIMFSAAMLYGCLQLIAIFILIVLCPLIAVLQLLNFTAL